MLRWGQVFRALAVVSGGVFAASAQAPGHEPRFEGLTPEFESAIIFYGVSQNSLISFVIVSLIMEWGESK